LSSPDVTKVKKAPSLEYWKTSLWQGVNIYKKNVKPNPNEGTTGGTVDKTMPIHASNIALVDANGKPSRVGIKLVDGKKVRFLKTTGATLSA